MLAEHNDFYPCVLIENEEGKRNQSYLKYTEYGLYTRSQSLCQIIILLGTGLQKQQKLYSGNISLQKIQKKKNLITDYYDKFFFVRVSN